MNADISRPSEDPASGAGTQHRASVEPCGNLSRRDALNWPADLELPPFAEGNDPEQRRIYNDLALNPPPNDARDLIIMVDGLGWQVWNEHRALTPTLRSLSGIARAARTVAPSTTATALTTLHTAAAPAEHGVLGYRAWDPATGTPVPQLTGSHGVDPETWMPLASLAERTQRTCIQVAPAKHRASFFTKVAYRGWTFHGHGRNDQLEATIAALRESPPGSIVHVHLDGVDHAGHKSGIDSDAWREAVAQADAFIGGALRRVPAGTRVTITADHGMVDIAARSVHDLSDDPKIDQAVTGVSGEPRFLMLRAPHAGPADLTCRVQAFLGDDALVLETEAAVRAGTFGPVGVPIPRRVTGRMGQVLIIARGKAMVLMSRLTGQRERELVGMHGSLTCAEVEIPHLELIS